MLPIIAMTAALGNCVLSFMSAWMVGKVEAPAKANRIELNAVTRARLKLHDNHDTFAKICEL